jgi:hypothetical protein
MKRFAILSILIAGFMLRLSAQTKIIVLKGKITDINQKGIPFAGIQNLTFTGGISSDENGNYVFKTKLPATFKISALGFRTQQKSINLPANSDTIELNFTLLPDAIELQAVNISAIHKPEEIIEADNLSDFEFRNNLMWLLYTNKNNAKLKITDTAGTEIAQENLKIKISALHKTENGFIYSFADDSVVICQWDTKTFTTFSVPYTPFFTEYLPISAYNEPFYYYMKEGSSHANIAYWYYEQSTGKKKILYSFVNEDLYNTNQSTAQSIEQAKQEMQSMGSANNVSEISSQGYMRSTRPEFRLRNLEMCVGNIYCPMKIIRDSIYIFNFDNDSIYVFDKMNNYSRRMPLTFDLYGIQYKNKNMLVDEEKLNCYFEYVINGITHLEKINLDNGERMNSQTLNDFPYLEKIRVYHDYAYFCYYDGFSSVQKRKIYRQRLD